MTHNAENLVGPAAACRTLDVELDALRDLVNRGRLPAYRIGEAVRFRPSELAALTRQEHTPSETAGSHLSAGVPRVVGCARQISMA